MSDRLSRLLSSRAHLVLDGAMGTSLMTMGLPQGRPPEPWNEDAPELVRQLHDAYVAAGADVLLTNSIGANASRLRGVGAERRVSPLNRAAATLARAAADAADRAVIVAGSVGPTGERIGPDGTLEVASAQRIFSEQAHALAAGGVDVLWLETFTSLSELGAAFDAAASTTLPIVATLVFGDAGQTLSGDSKEAVAAFFETRSPTAIAIGANCGSGPTSILEALRALRDGGCTARVLVAKSNCGLPERKDGRLVYPASPDVMAQYARFARDAGARLIGGCCGATPTHVRAMAEALATHDRGELPSPAEVAAALAAAPAREAL
jgi:5-methyltetrahydrofolate--homocysteine methyltransferase